MRDWLSESHRLLRVVVLSCFRDSHRTGRQLPKILHQNIYISHLSRLLLLSSIPRPLTPMEIVRQSRLLSETRIGGGGHGVGGASWRADALGDRGRRA